MWLNISKQGEAGEAEMVFALWRESLSRCTGVWSRPGSGYWPKPTVIGIVIAEVLQQFGAEQVRVKWPNDIYLRIVSCQDPLVELTGKTGDAAQIVSGAVSTL